MNIQRLTHPDAPRAQTGIVHLGLGAFFRAFGLPYISDAMAASGGNWGVVGVSLRSPTARDALREQDWAYTAVSLTADGAVPRVIDVLNDVLVAPENPNAVMDAMANPAVQIVTLTVTEKGYCHDPATGALNTTHPDILHDLENKIPKSALGFLVRALEARMKSGARPFTVLTCDNLPKNGRLLRGLTLELATLIDPVLAAWIEAEARFPCTMVDRITPATTQDDIEMVTDLTGVFDAAPVMHEQFSQWAVEDDFVDGMRPDFGAVGVELVADVEAYEDMKLRMLNGTHSALAYTGYLAQHETISDTVADPVFAAFVRGLWAEIMPAVQAPAGVHLPDYATALFDRYANPNIRHRTWQIAMDGSQKLPQRFLETLRDAFESERDVPLLSLSVAAWMRYVGGVDETGAPIDVRDPLAEKLRAISNAANSVEERVEALLGVVEVFPSDIAEQLRLPVTKAAVALWTDGARAAISKTL